MTSKIKKSRKPKVATPSDSDLAEDEIPGPIESDAEVPDLVASDGEQSSAESRQSTTYC